jgi:predicted glycosyltransferase
MSLQGKSVYFPVESLVGLGHFNRAGKIVREMVTAGADVTVASGTFVDGNRFFAGARRKAVAPFVFESIDGNHYTLDSEGRRTILREFNSVAHEHKRTGAHLLNISRAQPDILISEFWPFDRPQFDGEMQTMIGATQARVLGKGCMRVASVRDMLDVHEGGYADGEARSAYAARILNNHYDAVMVHGDPRFVTLDETFDAVDEVKIPIVYTGYVLADLPQRQTPDPATGAMVVSCGSGVNAHDMVMSFMAAWQDLIGRIDSDAEADYVTERPLHIICGPRFAHGLYEEVVQWGRVLQQRGGMPVTVDRYRTDLTKILSRAAFSVSLAGYNTTLETLALGVPSIMIPKYRLADGRFITSDEQWSRLQRLARQDMAAIAAPEKVSNARGFADMLKREFITQTTSPRGRAGLDFDGARRSVEILEGLAAEGPRPDRDRADNKFDLAMR